MTAGQVDALEGGSHPEAAGVAGRVGDLGGVQQGLGGDAAAVQAGAAEEVLLDEGHAQAELGGAQRAGVAAAPAAEDDDVVGGFGAGRHPVLLRSRGGGRWPASLRVGGPALLRILSLPAARHEVATRGACGRRAGPAPIVGAMAWWRRGRGRARAPHDGSDLESATAHLTDFVRTRRGVEAYVEPATNVTATTVVLIAHDGEWTRRALPSRPQAFEVARGLDVPVYDVNLTGYPARMRAWTTQQRREGRA